MDGVSGASAILSVVQVAWQAYTLCRKYYAEVKSARKDILNLNQEVASLAVILTNVSDLANDEDSISLSCVRLLIQKDGPVQQCQELLHSIIIKLDPGENSDQMKRFGKRALEWPFRSKDIERLLALVSKHKATLHIALATDTAGLMQAIDKQVAKLGDDMEKIHVEQKGFIADAHWKQIYQWLTPPDTSTNHSSACSKHQPTTGTWFLDCKEFLNWKLGSNSMLWLHGIPGCGKTILTSTIIENMTHKWKKGPGIAVVYFYFDFHDHEKRKYESLLRSLVVQLSMQCMKTPECVEKLFSHSLSGLKQPSTKALVDTLQEILRDFTEVFVIIDALDECDDRADLLEHLECVSNWQLDQLHILATSRRERDIEDSFEPLSITQLPIRTDNVNPDIRTYIRERVKKDARLKRWPALVKLEIEDTLMAKADGMFRWVVCQLDSLRKYLKQDIMRRALKSLPGDLNETYDQILKGIDEEYLEDAFKVLNWLVHSTRPLDLAELAEVVAVNLSIDEPQFDPGSRLGEPRDVLSICSSLVTTVTRTDNSDRDGHIYQIAEVRLAHFSVKEYLLSARVLKGDIEYTVDKEDQGIMAETCLTYLLHFQEPSMLTRTYTEDYPLAEYAANYWFIHAKEAKKYVDKVNRLGLKLGQSNGAFVNWIRLRDLDGYELGDHELSNRDIDRFPETETFGSPLYYAALAGLVELSKALIANGADVNEETGKYGHALQAASIAGHPEIITLLLENGADINAQGGLRGSALHAACYKGRANIVRLLLERGAHAHLEDKKHKTPLQIAYREKENGVIKVLYEMKPSLKQEYLGNQLRAAAHSGNLDKVKALLEEGVDVNRQGGLYDSALQAASHGGHVDIVKLLLANGADVNLRSFLDFDYDTPLQAAATEGRLEIVQILLDSGANINTEGGEARTPLVAAASMGHEAVVRLLLERGADINFHHPSCLYPSALAAAAFAGSEPIVRLLLDTGINLEYCNGAISSVSDGALVLPSGLHEPSWYQIVKLMHEKGGKYTPDAFRDMCRHAQLPIVNLMVETGLDFTPDAKYYHDVLKQIDDEEDDFKFMRTAKVNCEEEYEAIRAIIRRNIANLAK